jgi:tetratricopeptide (TPR) repeat protein
MKTGQVTRADNLVGDISSPLARKELMRRVREQPANAFFLADLVGAYLAEGVYAKALEASSKAYALAPTNPLVLWEHARALYMNERFADATVLHKRNLKKGVGTIARLLRWPDESARQLRNASRFDLALCYIQLDRPALAIRMLRAYLAQCRRKPYYSPDSARVKLRSLESLESQAKQQSLRLWISFLDIKALAARRQTRYKKGFTNGLVMARTRREAVVALRASLSAIGYELVKAEDTEEFDRRMLKTRLPDSTRKFADEVRRDGTARFTCFCMYPSRRNPRIRRGGTKSALETRHKDSRQKGS